MKLLLATFLLLSISTYSFGQTPQETVNPDCRSGICVDYSADDLNDEDLKVLREILKEDELPDHEYQIINVKSIIQHDVYLLSARKPNYYGIEIVLSKEGSKWVVLRKIKSIY